MPYRVENNVRTGEIACDKQFLLFSQCFPRYKFLVHQNGVLCGNGLTIHWVTEIKAQSDKKTIVTQINGSKFETHMARGSQLNR